MWLKIITIALMFIATCYGAGSIIENGKETTVGSMTAKRHLTGVACVSVAIVTVAYDVLCAWLLVNIL